ncbi:MAG TPA: hypothetical protein VFL97_09250 [Nitrococcus sp.]|nr:hypothetical protein [Nitrococcus sp.]
MQEGWARVPVRLGAKVGAQTDPAFDEWASQALAKLWATPALFPISMRPADNRLVLVPLSPARYRSLSFLDDREVPMARCFEVPLDRLLGASRTILQAERKPLHGIFHIAFCGSTLLARCLGRLAGALVLKEPYSFHEMAVCRRRAPPQANAAESWREAFGLLTALLARTFGPRQTAIVKPTDAATNLLPDVLAQTKSSRALFMYVGLEAFLQSVLRVPERRVFIRDRLEDLHVLLNGHPFFADDRWCALGDAERTACLWWLHWQLYRQSTRGPAAARGRSLDFAAFLADPADRLAAVACLFEIPASCSEIEAAVARELGSYSKDPGKAFTVGDRNAVLSAAAREYRDEIRAGIKWAERHFAQYPLPDGPPASPALA